jgi:hypothetical protein
MTLKLRRLTATSALILSAVFAVAAISTADARFTAGTQAEAAKTAPFGAVSIARVAETRDCKRKPKWVQRWNNELNRFVWKQIWVETCD